MPLKVKSGFQGRSKLGGGAIPMKGVLIIKTGFLSEGPPMSIFPNYRGGIYPAPQACRRTGRGGYTFITDTAQNWGRLRLDLSAGLCSFSPQCSEHFQADRCGGRRFQNHGL